MNEFELIKNYFQKLVKKNPYALNLNDDVFFDKRRNIVVSIDTYNEGIHYLNFKKPDLVIKKIIRSAISDLFCKGVKPIYIFLSGSGSKKHFNKKNLKLISKSISDEQKKFNIKLSGGDTTNSNKSSFSLVVLGFSNKIIKRNKVKNGDDIYVTGFLGDSYIGLNILKKKIRIKKKFKNYFIKKYYLPNLPNKIYKFLNKFANSSIDISDGLFSDLKKLISIFLKKSKRDFLNYLSKGDDYQIIFTSSKKNRLYIQKLSKRINLKISLIGSITNQSKHRRIIRGGKSIKSLNYEGYLHNF